MIKTKVVPSKDITIHDGHMVTDENDNIYIVSGVCPTGLRVICIHTNSGLCVGEIETLFSRKLRVYYGTVTITQS